MVAVFAFDALLSAAGIRASPRESLLIEYAKYWSTWFGRRRGGAPYPPEPSQKLVVTLAGQLAASNGRLEAVADLVGPGLDPGYPICGGR